MSELAVEAKRVFYEAISFEGDERTSYLDETCGRDSDLRRHVEQLLQAHENVANVNQEGDLLIAVLSKPTTAEEMNTYFFEKGITLSHLVKRKPSLEQQFLTITNNN